MSVAKKRDLREKDSTAPRKKKQNEEVVDPCRNDTGGNNLQTKDLAGYVEKTGGRGERAAAQSWGSDCFEGGRRLRHIGAKKKFAPSLT